MKVQLTLIALLGFTSPLAQANSLGRQKALEMRKLFAQGTELKLKDHLKKFYDCRTRSARKNSSQNGFFSLEIQQDHGGFYQTNTHLPSSDLNGIPLDMSGIEAYGTSGNLPESLIRIRSSQTGLVIEYSLANGWSEETDWLPVKKSTRLKGLAAYRVEFYALCTKSKYLDELNTSGIGVHTGTRHAYDEVIGQPWVRTSRREGRPF
jgi:hypothetical protein